MNIRELEEAALNIRINLLILCNMENIHIGGDLSICDVVTALWQYKIKYFPSNIKNEERDRFVLSKGHASAVTSFNQAAIGCFTTSEVLEEYAQDQGRFSMHSCNLVNPYVEVSTGSLGHGLSIACGIAQALRMKGNMTSRVYTVMGDGEQSEGSVWEAVAYASKLQLGNLVAFIDVNGFEADGAVDKITGLGDIAEKYASFGWNTIEIDGNDMQQIVVTLDNLPSASSKMPTAVVCHTTKGKGVRFMENDPRWHTGKITENQLKEAVEGLKEQNKRKWEK